MKLLGALASVALLAAATTAPAEMIRSSTTINGSGSITAGGVPQQCLAGDASRAWLMVQNPTTATQALTVDFGNTPTVDQSPTLSPGGSILMAGGVVTTNPVNVLGATTGNKFICEAGR